MNTSNKIVGITCMTLAGFGYGLTPALVRIVNNVVPIFTSMFLRYALVSIAMVLILTFRRELRNLLPRRKSDALVFCLIGVIGAGLSNIAYSLSILTTSISNAAFLFSLYAVFTPLLGGFWLHEWPISKQWLALLVALVGVGLLLLPDARGNMLGNVLGIVGALIVSIQYVGVHTIRTYKASVVALYLALGNVAISLPLAVYVEWLHLPWPWKITIAASDMYPLWINWAALIAFSGLCLTINLLVSKGLRFVSSSLGGVLLLLEPVTGFFIGLAFFGEKGTLYSLCGTLLILLSTAVAIWAEGTKRKDASATHSVRRPLPLKAAGKEGRIMTGALNTKQSGGGAFQPNQPR